ncbi:YybS family protein [Syntrophobacter fumaroxidans]|uniref:Conserved hypothetical membrane protein n=1 Tax=Syntrophobacter fumaroxidans (strain DSM 10017 / MPOB) TaxID=335543 RepID=A0LN57_SYNFM|nr:YybS family protein [Syntrophobacter fumaroxidans]ABK18859.1 conserved hypothetical membrane protein [Syntrophobacter fumaroxidans MPOB]
MGLFSQNNGFDRNPGLGMEIAVGTTATLISFLAILLIPVAGVVAGVLTPLPTLLSLYRRGRPMGYWGPGVTVLAGVLLLVVLGMPQIVPYFCLLLSMGVLMGLGMRRQWSIEKTIGVPTLFVFVAGAFLFWLAAGDSETGFAGFVEEDLRNSIRAAMQQYGGEGEEKKVLEQSLQNMVPFLVKLLPGAAVSTTLLAAWFNVVAARRYCRMARLPFPAWGQWLEWKAPDHLIWGVIAAGVMLLVPGKTLTVVGLNLLLILATVYLFQGLAILGFYFERWKMPRAMRLLSYGIVLLQQFATMAVILLGLFDLWCDFRRLTRKPAESP